MAVCMLIATFDQLRCKEFGWLHLVTVILARVCIQIKPRIQPRMHVVAHHASFKHFRAFGYFWTEKKAIAGQQTTCEDVY